MKIHKGSPTPLGFSLKGSEANFSIFSSHALRVTLGLFQERQREPEQEIDLYRTGDVWHVALSPIPLGYEYAFRCEGPWEKEKGDLYRPDLWLIDPYTQFPQSSTQWGKKGSNEPRAKIVPFPEEFDWEGVEKPRLPLERLVIYEMHVRGFTKHPSSHTTHPGTYLGIIEKIPYLKELGVNVIELMPVFEFDEMDNSFRDPSSGKPLFNYWGYHPLHFFAPMRRYAARQDLEGPLSEFRTLARELHRHQIELWIDVVYNHTGEPLDPYQRTHFRGLDNAAYYLLDAKGNPLDYTGCGNTLRCAHPAVQNLILDSLRFWTEKMGVDGFRFDLAPVLTRDLEGKPSFHPLLLEKIAQDPLLQEVKLVAEAWDASGLYLVGSFPQWGPWCEWNATYRDQARRFLKGTQGSAKDFALSLTGSQPLYGPYQTPFCSINHMTNHDGFSLSDLVSYEEKHNLANGERNRDGTDQNESSNCGVEGETEQAEILALRERKMRNFLMALLLSQGIPMFPMGDEYGHTRHGNNNPYTQDNEIHWFLWDEMKRKSGQKEFVQALIAFRKKHPLFQEKTFWSDAKIQWHGAQLQTPDWSDGSRLVALTLQSTPSLYLAFYSGETPISVAVPPGDWRRLVDTAQGWTEHHLNTPESAPMIQNTYLLAPFSALLSLCYTSK